MFCLDRPNHGPPFQPNGIKMAAYEVKRVGRRESRGQGEHKVMMGVGGESEGGMNGRMVGERWVRLKCQEEELGTGSVAATVET